MTALAEAGKPTVRGGARNGVRRVPSSSRGPPLHESSPMKKSSRILSVVCIVVAASLLVSSCSSTKAVKQDFAVTAGEVWNGFVTFAVAILAVLFDSPQNYGDDDISDCNEGSTVILPVAVANTYTSPMAFSVTVSPDLSSSADFYTVDEGLPSDGGCALSGNYNYLNGGTTDVTVQAGSLGSPSFTVVGWVVAGGGQFAPQAGSNHNISIGAGGSQWYDFWLHLDALSGRSFSNLELNYSNTGGVDPSQNVQTGLFNGLDCEANAAGNITLTNPNQLTTPFTSDNANAWTYNANDPICFGFLQPNSFSPS